MSDTENKYFSSGQNNHCPVVIDVHGKNSVICISQTLCHPLMRIHLTIILDIDLSLGMRFFLMMHLNLMLYSGYKATGDWRLWYHISIFAFDYPKRGDS